MANSADLEQAAARVEQAGRSPSVASLYWRAVAWGCGVALVLSGLTLGPVAAVIVVVLGLPLIQLVASGVAYVRVRELPSDHRGDALALLRKTTLYAIGGALLGALALAIGGGMLVMGR